MMDNFGVECGGERLMWNAPENGDVECSGER